MTHFKKVKMLSAILLVFTLSLGLFFVTQGQTGTSNITVVSMPNLSIAQIAASNSNYSTLVSLVQLANLTDALSGSLSLTVFAPTNDAFAKLPAATVQSLMNNPSLLRSILAYHIIPNTALTIDQLRNLQLLPTASGQALQVSVTAGAIRVNNASLISPSISASAGIIHTVDTVLVPPANATATPMIVPANQTTITTPFDLTNQNSPYAATVIGNSSVTKLVNTSLPQVRVQLAADNFTAPMMIASAKDGTGRLFVVDQIGLVWIIAANGTRLPQPFMDLRSRIIPLNPVYDERGLLSLAFHPNFAVNGKLYVHYDAPLRQGGPANWSHTVHIAEFTVSANNPNMVNNNSERTLMLIDKPQGNHNGGPVLFGPDGYLYITLGDGGGANDVGIGHTNQTGNAQDLTKVLGKTLRIDVNQNRSTIDSPNRMQPNLNYVIFSGSDVIGTRSYGIPMDNPFVGFATLPPRAYGNIPINGTIPLEIYSYGHRNPAYANFYSDNSTALLVAEAGQLLFEEVNLVRRGGNYGWRLLEGAHPFNASAPRTVPATSTTVGYLGEPLIGPIFEGGHDLGTVVVGGATYWGSAIPELRGKYVFGYFGNAPAVSGNGTLLVASPPAGWNASAMQGLAKCMMPEDNRMWQTQQITIANALQANATGFLRGVFADQSGELYVLMSSVLGPNASLTTGKIFKLVSASTTQAPSAVFTADLTGALWTSRVNASVTYTTNTSARGIAKFEVINNNTIRYCLEIVNINNFTMSHIHYDTGVVVGPIVVWLYPRAPPAQPIPGRTIYFYTTGTITAANLMGPLAGQTINDLINAIRAGRTYVEAHTIQNPQGEIRGYISSTAVTPAPTPTPTPTPTPPTPSPTPTVTPTPTAPSPTPTLTPIPTATATVMPTPTPTPTATPSPTASPGQPVNIQLYASEYTFGFAQNALTSPGPTLNLQVGDVVTVTMTNVGNMPHSWAVTTSNTGGTVLFGAAIGSASSGIQPGQTASDTFTVTQAGNFFYICPIPGHAQLGMWGNVVVTP